MTANPTTTSCLYLIHCQDDTTCGMVEASPRGGSKKRMDIYTQHKVRVVVLMGPA